MVVGVAEHRTVDFLKLLYAVLHDETLRELLGVVDFRNERLAVGGLADADARTEVGGLHDDGVAELAFHLLYDGVAAREPFLVGEPYIVDHRDAALTEYHLHRYLIHAVGRREGVASGVGDADSVEQTLEDAVFAVGAVKHGHHHMNLVDHRALGAEKAALGLVEVIVAVFGAHEHLGAPLGESFHVAVVADFKQFGAGEPASLLGDIDGDDVVFLAVESVDGLQGGNDRNLMLHTAAAEKHCYVCLHIAH